MKIVLASQSPRRRSLLELLISDFSCVNPDVDECLQVGETPAAYVSRLALM